MINNEKPVCLEIYSGTKTVSKTFEKHGWQSFSIDSNPSLQPDLCIDVLEICQGMLPGNVAFIWASIPCTVFSRAANQNHFKKESVKYRQYKYTPLTEISFNSVALIKKTIEIVSWFPGVPVIFENPIGRIHHFSEFKMFGHYRYFVNYFNFGKPYSKETYLFSNVWLPFTTKKYFVLAQGLRSVRSIIKRSEVPAQLVETIFNYLFNR